MYRHVFPKRRNLLRKAIIGFRPETVDPELQRFACRGEQPIPICQFGVSRIGESWAA
jgi:hypothetical protein